MEADVNAIGRGGISTLGLRWGWLLTLGIALILLGTIALGDTLAVTMISVLLVGWLLIAAGIIDVVHLIRHSEARTFWHILGIICDFVAGFYLVTHPALGALTLTLVLAAFLVVTGVTRIIALFQTSGPRRFWPVLDAVLSVVLGIMLWIHWPRTGLWFIGFAVAIGLIFRGWTWVMLSFALRGYRAQLTTSTQGA